MPINVTPADAAGLTPAKLASIIRQLQPRPAYCDERTEVLGQKAVA